MTSSSPRQPSPSQSSLHPWAMTAVMRHSQRLAHSFQHYLGRSLLSDLPLDLAPEVLAQQLFEAPCIIVSHGTEAEPIFNYGNAQALALWELSWEQLTAMPSRQTAAGPEQPERALMLQQALEQGYFEGYVGDRITSRGRRFRMDDGIIWTVLNEQGDPIGQAATFSRYRFLEA